MKQTIENFQLLKSEIRKVEKAAKHRTGIDCFLGGMSCVINPEKPYSMEVTCEMDALNDGSCCCDVKMSCCMMDRRRSFVHSPIAGC